MGTLSKREYDIIRAYRLDSPTKSLREIAQTMNLSAERIRQIEKNAFLKIQKYVRSVEWETANNDSDKNKTNAKCLLNLLLWFRF
jgi:DNA-directed RNA polymerase sigma subunit (sigma70/sigma32)